MIVVREKRHARRPWVASTLLALCLVHLYHTSSRRSIHFPAIHCYLSVLTVHCRPAHISYGISIQIDLALATAFASGSHTGLRSDVFIFWRFARRDWVVAGFYL